MFDKLKGTMDGISERAKEIADDTSEANIQKRNEQRMAAAAEREAAKEATKDKLSGDAVSSVLQLGAKVITTAKNINKALAVELPTSAKAPKGLPIKTEDEAEAECKPVPLTAKVPDWV